MSSGGPLGGGDVNAEDIPPEKMDKSLQKENKRMKGEIKQMEMKIKAMQVELTKSLSMKERLEGLCRELQKQNKYIKSESCAKIQEANARGKELATEVQNNVGFMKSINDNLAAISSESLMVKRENDELAKKIAILKGHYEEREQILQEALKETNDSLQKAKVDLGETRIKCGEEKEKLLVEMQKLADALIQSRDQVKESKKTEIQLRELLQSYEDKFNGLQKALKDTNGSYEEFRSEMTKLQVTTRTRTLEAETVKWQSRWEESNLSLNKMRQNFTRVQTDLGKSQENLDKMKALCRTLHNENRDLLVELKAKIGGSDMTMSNGNGNEETEIDNIITKIKDEEDKKDDASPPSDNPVKDNNATASDDNGNTVVVAVEPKDAPITSTSPPPAPAPAPVAAAAEEAVKETQVEPPHPPAKEIDLGSPSATSPTKTTNVTTESTPTSSSNAPAHPPPNPEEGGGDGGEAASKSKKNKRKNKSKK